MTLSFNNPTRSYDERRGVIRFIGHDGLNQILFLFPVELLDQAAPAPRLHEQGYLMAFDRYRTKIIAIAQAMYKQNNRSMIELDAGAVGSSFRTAN